ncbi:MAG: glycosyltransferase family 2 protein [Methylocystis sp.]
MKKQGLLRSSTPPFDREEIAPEFREIAPELRRNSDATFSKLGELRAINENEFPLPPTDNTWRKGVAPVAVVMISLNEEHNMDEVCQNLAGWAQEVFLVDSYSQDNTVDIALGKGVHVVQRRFRGFGDQWNFAIHDLPIAAPWTMKLDPDERLSDELKQNLLAAMRDAKGAGLSVDRRLWFMHRPLPVRQRLVRIWRSGMCRFTDVAVNEHPVVVGGITHVSGDIEHHDSPDLEHWLEKQNRYTTAEAIRAYNQLPLAASPRLCGNAFERRMWLKRHFRRLPFRFFLLFLYHWLWQSGWRAGWIGYTWARLRTDVMRIREYKRREIELYKYSPPRRAYGPGRPDDRVQQYD